jgi:hypothetical protein
MITAAKSLILDSRIFQRSAAVRAMRLKRSDAALLVAKDNYLFAEDLYFLRQIAKFVGGAYGLPIAPQQFAHRATSLDDGKLIGRWDTPAIG